MAKPARNRKGKSAKLHLEIPQANWARIEAYLSAYNEDGARMTPRIKAAHVINMALEQYLQNEEGVMAAKIRDDEKKKGQPRTKRVVTEIAPGIRAMLDAHIQAHNEAPERVSPLKYTDIINQALDEFLPARPKPEEEILDAQ